jgi:hypothetical protein
MTKTLDFKLSVLLLLEGEVWVAQCLEYDIAAQGRTIPEVKEAFGRTFAGQVFVDLHHNEEPLSHFAQAPAMYWDKFKKAERLADRQPILIPSEALPPAFMIHAMADDLRIAA